MAENKEIDIYEELCDDKNDKKAHRAWVFTFNNPIKHGYITHEYLMGELEMSKHVKYCCWSLETGKKGTPHWQGWLLCNPCKFSYFKKNFMGGKAYWAPGSKRADDLQRQNYVTKAPLEGPWSYGTYTKQGQRTDLETACEEVTIEDVKQKHPEVYVKYHNGLEKLFASRKQEAGAEGFKENHKQEVDSFDNWKPWQEDIIYLANCQPDRRTIYWFWETDGNIGKSTIGDHLIIEYQAVVLAGKVNDMRYSYSNVLSPVVVFDLCRTQVDCMRAFAHFCEELKNGRYMNGKYDSKMILFRKPHIFVFANVPYCGDFFSADRVKCFNVDDYPVCKF